MLQSRASVANDMAEMASGPLGLDGMTLFVEVDSLDRVRGVASDPGAARVTVAERETFYGMREIGLRLPGGLLIIFAEKIGKD